ncbi:hypothetical protein Fmac_028175 [Flemingia macrophylla]|uniref:Uncharacterized protein n=1 Tax=Flemingia macrophylla TaxID=520843 RepID=A0ABD1L6S3_9FABA
MPLLGLLADSKAGHAVRGSRASKWLSRHACACCSLGSDAVHALNVGLTPHAWSLKISVASKSGLPCLPAALPVALMIHDNSSDRTAFVPATHHSNFCPINFRWDSDPIVLAFGIGVMINEGQSGAFVFHSRRGEILGFMKDEQLRKHLPRMFSLIKNENGGSKTIDDRYRPSLNHKRCRPGDQRMLLLGLRWHLMRNQSLWVPGGVSVMPLDVPLDARARARAHTDVFNESIALADRPGKRESSARVDYVPALCTHTPVAPPD